jgi:deoxyribonuclease-1
MAWDRQFPITPWESERNKRIAAIMGHGNPFVTGERSWTPGYKPAGDGIVIPIPQRVAKSTPAPQIISTASTGAIIGNKNSNVYHLPNGCPSYVRVRSESCWISKGGQLQVDQPCSRANCRLNHGGFALRQGCSLHPKLRSFPDVFEPNTHVETHQKAARKCSTQDLA